MNVERGDVVLVDYPYSGGGLAKVRPALVVQNNRDNQRLVNTIVVQITSLTRRALEPTQLLIKLTTPAGQQSGLRQDSVVNCVNLLTLDKDKVLKKLGTLPDALMQQVNDCLKSALELP
ncbi:MAG TPA: type II toxin-antitoxin system PemK/MazF family toxin [Blastocatellia bacterium]|nr:type II toxin-antitoxin system PemK/MazF family toxin [Blastocatellia bacterium]HMV85855.1 type II toxin-antitoxin system PemK/MazF family toxin [Blastocatellia bacterium]HMX29674.1 type II toxin-antitoxin system PemK/MazF family toxin [Blastocatellia bacterium]HMY71929.1 type II toxin-antitoxin system PemK/MazF family toxin [Blastocatellia bacterium]HMZ19070.1 type II toxin-antitoxin system PemK/MazF family toxin [Blastocatellia bacterium]